MSDEITPIDLREVADECTHDPVVRNHLRGAADIIEALRAANARLQAWHDAVMGQETIGFEIVFKTGKWLKYDPSGFAPETKTELIIRPQPLAKE